MSLTMGDYFLLQLRDDNADYQSIAGLRTSQLSLQVKPLERLDFDAAGWRHLQPASGVQSLSLAGSGLFVGAAADHLMRRLFSTGAHGAARIIVPEFGTFSGPFAITELAYEGRSEELVSWRVALQSAGDIDFASA